VDAANTYLAATFALRGCEGTVAARSGSSRIHLHGTALEPARQSPSLAAQPADGRRAQGACDRLRRLSGLLEFAGNCIDKFITKRPSAFTLILAIV